MFKIHWGDVVAAVALTSVLVTAAAGIYIVYERKNTAWYATCTLRDGTRFEGILTDINGEKTCGYSPDFGKEFCMSQYCIFMEK